MDISNMPLRQLLGCYLWGEESVFEVEMADELEKRGIDIEAIHKQTLDFVDKIVKDLEV